jgi:uracil-DNA glycosylase
MSWEAAREALPADWRAAIGDAFDAPYMQALDVFLAREAEAGKAIYPPEAQRFAALARTPLAAVRAVILGQDPYHGPGQAMGLSFSVPPGIRVPPSLRNIHKELQADLGLAPPGHGSLLAWADHGVLLLNTALSVAAGEAGSHARAGWHRFTDRIIAAVDAGEAPVAFILWGGHARKKAPMLSPRHLVLESEHPSPLSAHRGFFGSRPFSRSNDFLARHGRAIDWRLDPAA